MLLGDFDALLIALLVGKVLLTSLCIACGFYGGIVAPALFVGAVPERYCENALSVGLGIGHHCC